MRAKHIPLLRAAALGVIMFVAVDLSPLSLIELCLAENARRLAGYDDRLIRPAAVPRLARLACRLGRLFGGRNRPR